MKALAESRVGEGVWTGKGISLWPAHLDPLLRSRGEEILAATFLSWFGLGRSR